MEQVKLAEWVNTIKQELERRTKRTDIEVVTVSHCDYDVLVSCAASTDKHPIISFFNGIQGNDERIRSALEYTSEMLLNWELTQVQHEKAKQDCLPFYEQLKAVFPTITLKYSVLDFDNHAIQVEIADGKTVAYFDLWAKMDQKDMDRLIFLIGNMHDTLKRQDGTCAKVSYSWK